MENKRGASTHRWSVLSSILRVDRSESRGARNRRSMATWPEKWWSCITRGNGNYVARWKMGLARNRI